MHLGQNYRHSTSTGAVNKYGVKLSDISALVQTAISDQVSALYSVGITDEEASMALWSVADATSDWIRQQHPTVGSPGSPRGTPPSPGEVEWTGLESWEEMMWCPVLGIKGQVDLVLTGQQGHGHAAGMSGQGSGGASRCAATREVSLPVELKTGKWRPNGLIGHRAQVILKRNFF